MCGIVGYVGNKSASDILFYGLSALEYRGYDSAGVAVADGDNINIAKTTQRLEHLKTVSSNGETLPGNIGIGHTRWATHGAPEEKNAHPHISDNFAVVHNGIIENYTKLKKELKKQGVIFKSETDTEVIPFLLSKNYNGDFLSTVLKSIKNLEGSFALAILNKDNPDMLIATKRFSPLIIGLSMDGNFVASDVTALIPYTKKIIYLEDGQTAVLKADSVCIYDINGDKKEPEIKEINWDVKSAEKGGFNHFMMKEIYEQPSVIEKTIDYYVKNDRVRFENLKMSREKLSDINKIHIVACGSAYHAGVVGKFAFEKLLNMEAKAEIASEYRYSNPFIDKNTLVVVISQSGETADTIAALSNAKEKGAYILSVVNVVGSTIARMSDDCIYTLAGPEISVATTKGYTTQLCVLYLLAVYMAEKREIIAEKELHSLLSALRVLPEKIEEILEKEDSIKYLAQKAEKALSLFFVGRNTDYAVALEASLKLKEISYIHSESYPAGELKHGTISLIEEGKIVFALCGNKELNSKMVNNIKEVKSRGAYVISVAIEGSEKIKEVSDEIFYIPETHPLFVPVLEVLPFQIYAYYVALLKGCDIDKPRNLAKSVTVE